MLDLRIKTRGIILSITGLIVVFLLIRFFLELLGSDGSGVIVEFINSLTDLLIAPFDGFQADSTNRVNYDVLVSILSYTFLGIAISEVITAFMYEEPIDIVQNLIDAVFKFIELSIFLRIVFYLIQLNKFTGFGGFVFDITNWTQVLGVNIPIVPERLDWNAIIFLFFIVLIDIFTENLINSLAKKVVVQRRVVKAQQNKPLPVQQVYVQQPTPVMVPQQQRPQNITINVPLPPQQRPPQR